MLKASTSKVLVILIVVLATSLNLKAAVKMATLFGDDMVLQRGMPVPVWGWELPGATVTVTFGGQAKAATVGEDGAWGVRLDPMKAESKGRPLMVISDKAPKNPIVLKNVVVGEVWICSGQSNMVRTANYKPANEDDAKKLRAIRHVKIATVGRFHPEKDVKRATKWLIGSDRTVGAFTGVGFFFAKRLQSVLDVPIGLIHASWGGSRIEAWIPRTTFESHPELAEALNQIEEQDSTTEKGSQLYGRDVAKLKQWVAEAEKAMREGRKVEQLPKLPLLEMETNGPTNYYNGLIHGLAPFAVRGAIWYQGESNGTEGITYFQKLKALVEGWRSRWGQETFHFGIVQLPNFRSDSKVPAGGDGWAKIREAQRMAAEAIPDAGLAVTIELGDASNLHPPNKKDVGERMAMWALADVYGKSVVGSGPTYKAMRIEGNKARITFDNVGDGLMIGEKSGYEPVREIPGGTLKRFAIAGEDGKWRWGNAVIDGDEVVISHPEVKAPVAVRYAFSANPEGANLYNKAGLPAVPFATDGLEGQRDAAKKRLKDWRENYYASTFEIPPEWETLSNPKPIRLSGPWTIRIDPRKWGEKKKWFAPDATGEDWRPIEVPSFWAETDLGDYEGDAWYRTEFNVPAAWKNEPVRLLFCGVDEQAWVYVNGVKVGERTVESTNSPLAALWEQPFAIEIPPERVKFEEANLLVVRVRNEKANGGVWKPILLHAGK